MDWLINFLNEYGIQIIGTILVAFAGYLGIVLKNVYIKYVNDETKKSVVNTCVQAIEQLYKDLHGEEKYNMAVQYVTEMLNNKGIKITDLEIKMLVESAVGEFNDAFNKTTEEEKLEETYVTEQPTE